MKIRTVLIWFVIAGLLAFAVAMSRSGSNATQTEAQPQSWSIEIDPARAESIELKLEGTTHARAERAAAGIDRWILSGPAAADWPADPERVRAALRLLATTAVSVSEEELQLDSDAPMIYVTESDGRSVEISFDPRASGGQVNAIIDVRDAQSIVERRVHGRLPANLFDALIRTEWGVWREQALFDSVTATAKSLTIEAGPNKVRLERGPRGWAIVSPYALEADSEEVARALSAIGSLRAESFIDQPPPIASTGLDRPLATITVATETNQQQLSLGRATDNSGKSIFATFNTSDTNTTISINPETVAQLTAVPEAYARRIPLGIAAADIGQIRLIAPNNRTRFHAKRQAGEWLVDGATASPDQRDAIDRALRVLTLESAASVATQPISETHDGHLGEFRCFTAEGIPVASVSLRVGDELKLHIARPAGETREIVWTTLTDNAKGVVLWASALLSRG